MKTRKTYFGAALLCLAVATPAVAHDTSAYARPAATWSGSAIVWGGSQGFSGWTGTISYNAGYAYAPVPVPVTVLPPPHRHGPACYQGRPRAHAHHKGHRYDRRHEYRH
jgi:hypothetical protein